MCRTFSKATQLFDFIKHSVIRKLANKVKYINQINLRFDHVFTEIPEEHFLKLSGSIENNIERINTRKRTQSTVQRSKCEDNFHFLSRCYRPIDNSIDFYFFYLVVKRLMITTNLVVKIQNLVVNHESRPVMPKVLTSFQANYLANLDGEIFGKELIFIATTKKLTRKCLRILNSFMIIFV